MSTKKKMPTKNIVASAHPTMGSESFARYFTAMPTVRNVSTISHSRIEPSSALQTAVKL